MRLRHFTQDVCMLRSTNSNLVDLYLDRLRKVMFSQTWLQEFVLRLSG